jgi:hypothetical protein
MIGNNGRGSTQSLAHGDILVISPHLSNDQRLPVMVMMTFSNGCFAMPSGSRSLTGEMLLSNGAGAVAAFASTRLTRAKVQKLLDQCLVEVTFQKIITRFD